MYCALCGSPANITAWKKRYRQGVVVSRTKINVCPSCLHADRQSFDVSVVWKWGARDGLPSSMPIPYEQTRTPRKTVSPASKKRAAQTKLREKGKRTYCEAR